MDTEKIRILDSYKSLLFKKITDLNHSRFTSASTSAESALGVLATMHYILLTDLHTLTARSRL